MHAKISEGVHRFIPPRKERRETRDFAFAKPRPRHFQTVIVFRRLRKASRGGGGARWRA
jgi:hypothetical protein